MSVDLSTAISALTGIIASGFLVLGAYKAFAIGRVLVSRVFRNRAFWTAAILLVIVLGNVANLPPFQQSPFGTLLIFALAIVILPFVDTSIQVSTEMDFFHRDTLRWRGLRIPLYVVMFASTAVIIPGFLFFNSPSLAFFAAVVIAEWFAVFGFVLAYSAAALIVGARRNQDRTMKKFVKELGLGLGSLAIYFTIWLPLNAIIATLGDIVSSFFGVFAAFFFYRAVMSLSPLSRIDVVEAAGSTTPGMMVPGSGAIQQDSSRKITVQRNAYA